MSWEIGTRTQTILELNATRYSVFSNNNLPPPPSSPPDDLSSALEPFFSIAKDVVANRPGQNISGPRPLLPDGSAGDPASIGMCVLLANWTGVDRGSGLDYAGAAKDELDWLLSVIPRTDDGAISHRENELQLWSDSVYMVPPFLAYYGIISNNQTLLMEAYNQIKLYRNYLRDSDAQNRWKHVVLGSGTDEGAYNPPGNGWAAAGMLRVLATIRNSPFAQRMKDQQGDLTDWIEEIHDGMYAVLDTTVNLWTNYPDVPADSPGNFYDTSGSALLAATVFRAAVMLNQFTHVPAAEKIRQTLFSPSGGPPSSTTTSSTHLTPEGWLTPVVNPYSFPHEGSMSPESEAFAIQLHSAWRDWVADGARGANGLWRFLSLSVSSLPVG
ncbi:hypothetical protein AGABI1DRAFT_101862 [Agaricus bisporus var. burnettii JB137-S8]|uniref:Uncharacterized protein n=1 Tax=Agaricus bisporus var. burnettii (strain JB137-S8 / ATCC MYA-4627 / FGSC 10392) TaxID=597362 RepID=K5XQR1_AGABU|nr:uncharacterized protein AGABI1DRAFT_101862 [Agaricus bisporus var. burnettii JB137-S8]EKM77140.1 hypothetical protein AGABI1DRAFT_101862 [Agaricus bisporus var. burnettii JB137-S8]